MGFFDRLEAQASELARCAREMDELLSHATGNLTETIKCENARGKYLAETFFELFPELPSDPHIPFLTSIHAHLINFGAKKLHVDFATPTEPGRFTL